MLLTLSVVQPGFMAKLNSVCLVFNSLIQSKQGGKYCPLPYCFFGFDVNIDFLTKVIIIRKILRYHFVTLCCFEQYYSDTDFFSKYGKIKWCIQISLLQKVSFHDRCIQSAVSIVHLENVNNIY